MIEGPASIADQEQVGRGDLIDLYLPPEWDVIGFRRSVAIPFGIVMPGRGARTREGNVPLRLRD
jgi:hypothetical protein